MRLTRGCRSAPLLVRGGALPSRGGARLSRLPAESFRAGTLGRALHPGAGLLSLLSDAASEPSQEASLPCPPSCCLQTHCRWACWI